MEPAQGTACSVLIQIVASPRLTSCCLTEPRTVAIDQHWKLGWIKDHRPPPPGAPWAAGPDCTPVLHNHLAHAEVGILS